MPYAPFTTLGTDDVLSRDRLNTYLFQPISLMISPPFASYNKPIGDANITTTSAIFTAVDDTLGNFYLQVSTLGNPVEVGLRAVVSNAGIAGVIFDVEIDGTLWGTNGLAVATSSVAGHQVTASFREIIPMAAGGHDFKLRWKVTAGTGTLVSAYKPQFYVREL